MSNKTLFTIRIPVTDEHVRKKQPPVEKAVRNKKIYCRKEKHKKDWVAERPPYFFLIDTLRHCIYKSY
jgi:hypothetical protein